MRNGLSCLAAFALVLSSSPAVAQTQLSAEESVAAEVLAEKIETIARSLPAGTQQAVFEARFSVALANFNGKCNAAIAALRMASALVGSGAALQALKGVQAVAARCQQGTAAGTTGNGPKSTPPPSLPGLNTGGGANYSQ